MTRSDIINAIIQKFNYKSYLEIGVQNGVCFNKIKCEYKTGVDPSAIVRVNYPMTSDQFFLDKEKGFVLKSDPEKYDCYFIDGLHEADQVLRDIRNALRYLSINGTIICHDMNPLTELAQRVPRETKVWNGDCWKALVVAGYQLPISFFTVNTDHGCSIIRPKDSKTKTNQLAHISELSYKDLENNRKELLNLISVDEFKQWLVK